MTQSNRLKMFGHQKTFLVHCITSDVKELGFSFLNCSMTNDQKIFFWSVQEVKNNRHRFLRTTQEWFVTIKMHFSSQNTDMKRQKYDIDCVRFENRTDFFHGNRLD